MNLREEFDSVKADAQALINGAIEAKRDLSPEECEKRDRLYGRLDQIKAQLQDQNKAASFELEQFADVKRVATGNNEPSAQPAKADEAKAEKFAADVKREVNAWMRGSHEQFVVIQTSGSSALVPTTLGRPVTIRQLPNAFEAALAAYGYPAIVTQDASVIQLPVFDDTSNVGQTLAQDHSGEVNADPGLSPITLGANLYTSKAMWFSNTLLLNSAFDVLDYCMPFLERRIDLAQQNDWTAKVTVGGGAATVGRTLASTTGITTAEVFGVYHSLPPVYRADMVIIGSDGLMQAVRSLVDANGRPIYVESLSQDMPDRLLGVPFFVNSSLSAPAAGGVSAIVASASSLFERLVSNRRISRYVNIPDHPDQTGIALFENADFGFNSAGVRLVKQAAS